jgi:hypothetical protein
LQQKKDFNGERIKDGVPSSGNDMTQSLGMRMLMAAGEVPKCMLKCRVSGDDDVENETGKAI